ncbi:2Fe-2S iron-sulfur cluster binding domain-containing protein [Pseudomonas veronii]|uniref:2Fe-2S iron-sulfur cluster binding domain-containing protein n=1 Tax=Pseudomonas veronii TaxID=76761 RepID=A0A7Y1AD03_PSEVE|nr:2Fe-2S iron-sulfur cluster-binding protein [Pseudomonas veronii]NMY13503.1 2Fe-2S iron-sulfur cluster binding domain-containing protein [Pseudomonas veronii]
MPSGWPGCCRSCGETAARINLAGDRAGRHAHLQGMARIGRKCIPAGCLNGGCGVCKVAIRAGEVHKSGAMSRAHVTEQEEAAGVVLACRVVPDCEVELEVVGKMKKAFLRSSAAPNEQNR